MSNLAVTQREAVLTLSLGRPAEGNRINEALASAVREACQRANRDDAVRVVVVTGEGAAFCTGSALNLRTVAAQGIGATELEVLLERHSVAQAIAGVEKPVIAAINGDALGQGLELALACDLRVAAEGARLGFPQVGEGVLPWDGGTQRLARIAGRGVALELLLTGRTVSAQEGQRSGIVHQVCPSGEVVERAQALAARIAELAPIAARYAKETVLKGLDMTLEQGLRLEADLNFILHSTYDRAEGLRSFMERREPRYRGE